MDLLALSEGMILQKASLTHILHSITDSLKALKELMDMLDLVQNHLLLLRDLSSILYLIPHFAYTQIVSNSMCKLVRYYLQACKQMKS